MSKDSIEKIIIEGMMKGLDISQIAQEIAKRVTVAGRPV